jgi:polysaccharide biosynthesis transport protein
MGAAEQASYRTKRRRKTRQVDEALPAAELFVHHRPASGTAEAARAIRTNILFTSPDRPYNTLLVTSAGPSEGKTTVACSIAITMAQAGQRVVLVDCDLRRPRVHRVFGRTNDLGLTTALLDGAAEAGMASETDVPNLSVIPTGPIPPNPAELLQSAAFSALLERLRGRYDRVVLDSPPLVPVTDAAILSTLVDGTILVVRASRTTRELARRAQRALRDVNGRTVGVVLNAVDLEGRNYGYYQYYQYKRDGYGPLQPAASLDDRETVARGDDPMS